MVETHKHMNIKHIAPNGNNSNSGNSFEQAYRDFWYSLGQLAVGDKLSVYGTDADRFDYNEGINNQLPSTSSGNWNDATTIEVVSGHNVWLKPPSGDYGILFSRDGQEYAQFIGLNIDAELATYGGIKVEGWANGNPHHIRFAKAKLLGPTGGAGQGVICDAQKPGIIGGNEFLEMNISRILGDDFSHGLYIKSGGNIIDRCNVYEVPGACVHLYATYPADGNIITRNRLHDIAAVGAGQRHWGLIASDNCFNTIILSNIIFNIPNEGASSCGMLISQNANGAKIGFNSVTQCQGVGIQVDPTVSGAVARNNISFGNGVNFVPGNVTQSHNIQTNPKFKDPSMNDFTITDKTSPAYHAGIKVSGWTHDALMNLYNDPPSCGAYEILNGGEEPPPDPEFVDVEGKYVTVNPLGSGIVARIFK